MPFSKLSEWPYLGDSRHYSTLTADLSALFIPLQFPPISRQAVLAGMYRTVNENCVWFRHSFKDGQHGTSTYVVHTIRHQTSSSAKKFFSRVEHLGSSRATRSTLLSFMAIDVMFNDMNTAHSDLNDCYRNLRTAVSRDSVGLQPVDR